MSNDKTHEELKNLVLRIVADLECRNNDWKKDLTHGDRTDDDRSIDELGACDYLNDVLGIEYVVNSDNEYLGARILVAFGGPSIWIDTRRGIVDAAWWNTSYSASFNDVMGVDDYLREIKSC